MRVSLLSGKQLLVLWGLFCSIAMFDLSSSHAEDWPTFRNNLRRNAVSRESIDAERLTLAWEHQAAAAPSTAWHGPAKWDAFANLHGLRSMRNYDGAFQAIMVDSSVYFGSSGDDSVTCLRAVDGKVKWRFFTDAPVRVAPTFWKGRLFFGSDDGFAYCVDAKTGEEIWRFCPVDSKSRLIHNGRFISHWPIRTGVAVNSGSAYFAASLVPWKPSYLCSLDAETGKPISVSHFSKKFDHFTFEGPLVLSSKLLISPQGRVPPLLFRISDGKLLGEIGVAGKSSPKKGGGGGSFVVVTEDDRVVHGPGNKAGWLTRSNSATRERIATHRSGRELVVVEGITYLISDRSISALDYKNDKKLWQSPCEDPSTLIAVGDCLVVGKVGEVVVFSRKDGRKMWRHPVAGDALGLAFSNGRLVVSTTEGNLLCFHVAEEVDNNGALSEEQSGKPKTNVAVVERVAKGPDDASKSSEPLSKKEADAGEMTDVAVGPWLRFHGPRSAIVRWETDAPSKCVVKFRLPDNTIRTVKSNSTETTHQVELTDLEPGRMTTYWIESTEGSQTKRTKEFECDAFFNYSQPTGIASPRLANEEASRLADKILGEGCSQNGLCLILGADEPGLAAALAEKSALRIAMFCRDAVTVRRMREQLLESGLYGSRITVSKIDSSSDLPLTSHCADLVLVSQKEQAAAPAKEEIVRVLAPQGKAIVVRHGRDGANREAVTRGELVGGAESSKENSEIETLVVGEELAGSGSWSHIYGAANNSAFGGEELALAETTEDLEMQWIGRPGPRYQADRSGRKAPPLSTSGRLFLQGMNRVVAINIYNGTVLWSLEIPYVRRFNMPRDCGNWCADEEFVYLAIRDRCWQLDASSGEVVRQMRTLSRDKATDWGFIADAGELIVGSETAKGASWSDYWGNTGWYDATEGETTHKVISRRLFAKDKKTGETKWQYHIGAILNSTITLANDRIYFVETRNSSVVKSDKGRVGGEELWKAQYLVALDEKTGQVAWEAPIDTEDGTIVFWMTHGNGRLVCVSSHDKRYSTYAYDDQNGKPLWQREFAWGKGKADHGTHLSRPAIVGNRLFVRPAVIALDSGEILSDKMPVGGCGTYACTTNALFFRVWSGANFGMWSHESEKYTNWSRLRPDCWLSSIPAGGLLLSPEGGGGCSCGKWMETSLAFIPKAHLPNRHGETNSKDSKKRN